jgi:3-hydroxy-3-methylglutaryl CoA synthase
MGQQDGSLVKAFTAKPDKLSSIPQNQIEEEENWPDFWKPTHTHTHTHTHHTHHTPHTQIFKAISKFYPNFKQKFIFKKT